MPFKPPGMSELLQQVTIKAVAFTRLDSGGFTGEASGTDTRSAKIEWMSGEEIETSDHQRATATRKITMRYYSGLTTLHYILFRSRRLDILAIDDVEEKHLWHVLKCKEVV